MRKLHAIAAACLGAAGAACTALLPAAVQAAEIANVPDSMRSRLSTSATGLTEQFGVTGRMVRLQGRFQSLSVARPGPDGRVTVNCLTAGPASQQAIEALESSGQPPQQTDTTAP